MKTSQCKRIIEYMTQFGSISTYEAFNDLGIARLASRIHDLKTQGYNIASETKTTKNKFGERTSFSVYKLIELKQDEREPKEADKEDTSCHLTR